jgi:uroporphyrinogen-III decarboxylase
LDDNMAREPGRAELPMPAASSAETAAQALSMKNMKYFKQDEAIFASCVPTAPKLAGVEAARPAEAPPAAAAPTVDVKPAELEISPPPVPAAAESGDKRRIVIIRRAATEPMEIPLQAELAVSPAP